MTNHFLLKLTYELTNQKYTIPMFKKGYRKTLDVDDLYNPIRSDRSMLLGDRLESKNKRSHVYFDIPGDEERLLLLIRV
ncbi:hypothetical protein NQ317_005346 [Molorchus minor]|uniref:Uncharacterized protein n=1 Tax=Molorchus minor TaxID=1323400 RepID=A0ABQ9JRL9_9CUCU|nr:hypothetical protein NQ317_005346 [Molorchus minor]